MKNFLKIAFFSVFVTTMVIAAYAVIYKLCLSNKNFGDSANDRNGLEIVENIANSEKDLNQEESIESRSETDYVPDTNESVVEQQAGVLYSS